MLSIYSSQHFIVHLAPLAEARNVFLIVLWEIGNEQTK